MMSESENPELALHLEMIRHFDNTGVGLLAMGFFYGLTICSFSCFPVVGPYVFGMQSGFQRSFEMVAIFMLSKVTAYTVLGALSGQLGAAALELLRGGWLLTVEGALITAIGAALVLRRPRCGCVTLRKPDVTQPMAQRPYLHMASLGVMTSLVPCLPLSATLLTCAASKSAAHGALYASLFGLGTLASPLYYAGGAAGWLSKQIVAEIPRHKDLLRRLSGAVLLILGLRLILSSL
jgi:cytochrome c biogenesis protein CcdA